MLGRWCYRSPWTHLVVGDFEVRHEPDGRLHIVEEHSRGGRQLSGALEPAGDGWLVAYLQEGHCCRLQLRDGGVLASQFREHGQEWEAEVLSMRLPVPDGTVRGWLASLGADSQKETVARSDSVLHGAADKIPAGLAYQVVVPSLLFVASGAVYACLYGLEHGLGLLGLLFVHELGHALAMKALGVKCGPMVFVPFIGAFVEMKVKPAPAYEGIIALAGPVLGSSAALACYICSHMCITAWSSEVLLRLAYWGFLLNALNLLPIGFLDGGRVVALLRREITLAGLALFGVAGMMWPQINLVHFFFLAGCYTTRPWRRQSSEPGLALTHQLAFAAVYFGLSGLLVSVFPPPRISPA